MSAPTDDIFSILSALRAYLLERSHQTAVRIMVVTAEDPEHPLVLPCPSTPTPATSARTVALPAESLSPPSINPTERLILTAVADLEEMRPTGEEIAAQAGMKCDPHFRKALSSLRERGLLGGKKSEAGYPITPAGLDAIAHNMDA